MPIDFLLLLIPETKDFWMLVIYIRFNNEATCQIKDLRFTNEDLNIARCISRHIHLKDIAERFKYYVNSQETIIPFYHFNFEYMLKALNVNQMLKFNFEALKSFKISELYSELDKELLRNDYNSAVYKNGVLVPILITNVAEIDGNVIKSKYLDNSGGGRFKFD